MSKIKPSLFGTVIFLIWTFPVAYSSARMAAPIDTAHYYMEHSFDVQKYLLNIDIYACYTAPYTRSFSAKEIITLRVDSALNQVQFNAVNSSIEIDSVGLAGISFTHMNDTLTVMMDRYYDVGEIADIKICYHHKNVIDNAFYVSSGYVYTDCPPEGARKWFPCWDRPSDKAAWELNAKVPLTVRLGSTGLLVDSTVTADTIFYHWMSSQPVATYLITISSKMNFLEHITYYHQPSQPDDSIPVRLYYKSGENLNTVNNLIVPLTDFYVEKFGPYPFEKIGFATLNNSFPWGGMENQTMVNLMPGGYSNEDLIAHEHSHQWFGDMITCGTWADIWLNEGFGTYCADLWVENKSGYDAYKNKINSQANYYLNNNPGWPIYNPEWAIETPPGSQLYNEAIIYDKGACVLHQLRYVLGDSVFFQVMSHYASDTSFMFKNAVTEDFELTISEVSGQDISWFFDEWVDARNHPMYENTYEINDLTGSWKVKLVINQVQTTTVFFKMPVQIEIDFVDGSDSLLQVMNDSNGQVCEFIFGKQPTGLTFDPLRNIPLKQSTTVVGTDETALTNETPILKVDPNPFVSQTKVSYRVIRPAQVSISVIDCAGKVIHTLIRHHHEPGNYQFYLTGDLFKPGLYYLNILQDNESESIKLIRSE